MKFSTLLTALILISTKFIGQSISRIETLQSLYIELYYNSQQLSSATGFVIKSKTQYYLITNWHVVTNKNPTTMKWQNDKVQISPNKIIIHFSSKDLGKPSVRQEVLYDKDGIKYIEGKINNEMIDVVALPLKDTSGNIDLYPVNFENTCDSILIRPTETAYIVGFPKGRKSGTTSFFPIYKSGTIASEPDIDEDNKPIIWIDGDTHPGMSGSPVYYINSGMCHLKNGQNIMTDKAFFLGVFSGTYMDINIGVLWKSSYLKLAFRGLP